MATARCPCALPVPGGVCRCSMRCAGQGGVYTQCARRCHPLIFGGFAQRRRYTLPRRDLPELAAVPAPAHYNARLVVPNDTVKKGQGEQSPGAVLIFRIPNG